MGAVVDRTHQFDILAYLSIICQAENLKIKQILEFLIERDAKDQRKLRRGAELPRFDGADGVAGHADAIGRCAAARYAPTCREVSTTQNGTDTSVPYR